MELVPTQQDVVGLLRQTGALRDGHFACPSGFHTSQYLETALAMRYYHHAKTLSVGLSRLVRGEAELRAMIPELSIVAATPAGLPVAYGICEALRARQVYWTEKPAPDRPMRFPPHLEPSPGERIVLVDDILRSGALLREAAEVLESRGARVVAVAVLVYQPTPHTQDLGAVSLHYLARLEFECAIDPAHCELCRQGVPLEQIGREPRELVVAAPAAADGC